MVSNKNSNLIGLFTYNENHDNEIIDSALYLFENNHRNILLDETTPAKILKVGHMWVSENLLVVFISEDNSVRLYDTFFAGFQEINFSDKLYDVLIDEKNSMNIAIQLEHSGVI